jgi:hypothetical protein
MRVPTEHLRAKVADKAFHSPELWIGLELAFRWAVEAYLSDVP